MMAMQTPKTFYFISMEETKDIMSKESVFQLIESLFQCSRIAISTEHKPDASGYYFHALFELSPGMLWKNVDSLFRANLASHFTLLPLHSFGKGVKYILATEQNPFFWNYDRDIAANLLDNMKARKKYTHLDVPKTSAITRGLIDVKRKAKEKMVV